MRDPLTGPDRFRLKATAARWHMARQPADARALADAFAALMDERDRLTEQVKDTEQAVHAYFADADQRGIHLDGMTVDELCDAVMAEIRALDGTEPGR